MSYQNISSIQDNPFAALFPSVKDAEDYSRQTECSPDDDRIPEHMHDVVTLSQSETDVQMAEDVDGSCLSLDQEKNCLIERIFLLTNTKDIEENEALSDNLPSFCIAIEDDDSESLHEAIEQLIFNRLLLQNPENYVVKRCESSNGNVTTKNEAEEDRPLIYLLQSYNRVLHEEKYVSPQLLPTIMLGRKLIIRNISTALISPELFEQTDSDKGAVHQQFYDLLVSNECMDHQSPPRLCLYSAVDYIAASEPQLMETAFAPMLKILSDDLKMDNLLDSGLAVHIAVLATLAGHPSLASLTLDYKSKHGISLVMPQVQTILEILLGKSCLVPDAQTKTYLFFEDIRRMGPGPVETEEYHLHSKTDSYHFQLLTVVRLFLKHETTRTKVLQWIGNFLLQHEYLAKMWTHEHLDVFQDVFGPDAALLNLSAVLMRLCLPFCSKKSTIGGSQESSSTLPKFLRIDASYIYATGQPNTLEKKVHGINMHKDTCLQSVEEGETLSVDMPESYNFITECFFLTHRAIYLGVHGLLKKFSRLNRSLSREEDLYRQLVQSGEESNDRASLIVRRFETGMRIYLSIKGILSEPNFLEGCMRLHATTAQYLNQIAMTDSMDRLADVVLPFPQGQLTPKSLFSVPEYVVENMTDMILFLWRFARSSIGMIDPFIHDYLLVITIYMGNKSRMSNPHLRASLAEVLQVVMPLSEDGIMLRDREEIFNKFPHSDFLTVATLQLFVDIEFTGDPNQFEQKFHYRQPLYKILKYLWRKKSCNKMIKQQVKAAIENIDDATHPLFLQFTNLLLNDSIYLLDEAMDFLKQIKGFEREKDAGEWEQLPQSEKMQKEAELKQLGMLAKYHNILSNETVDTLAYLTEAADVKKLFSHPLLGDRVAAMLDDFLLKLVGPKMGALRVRDFSVYKFQPKVLVKDLCKIYVNLCQTEDFCRAISRDGRSYGPKLFPMACQVLRRIGSEDIREKMLEVSEKIKLISNQEEEDEEMFLDAPDEFHDALMSTLMRDPVTLPASKQVVDRSTISRHLMSDPTDPFNRSPLTMQDIVPNIELKTRIEQWIAEKRNKKTNF